MQLPPDAGNATVRLLENRPDQQTLLVDGAGLLIQSAAFYPGWICTVDGQATRILPVDIGLRGVILGPGSHRVIFSYAPRWLPWTLGLGAVSAVCLAIYCLAIFGGTGRARGGMPTDA